MTRRAQGGRSNRRRSCMPNDETTASSSARNWEAPTAMGYCCQAAVPRRQTSEKLSGWGLFAHRGWANLDPWSQEAEICAQAAFSVGGTQTAFPRKKLIHGLPW